MAGGAVGRARHQRGPGQNLYLAAVGRGGVQKFVPSKGANPAYLVGKHVYSAWK